MGTEHALLMTELLQTFFQVSLFAVETFFSNWILLKEFLLICGPE